MHSQNYSTLHKADFIIFCWDFSYLLSSVAAKYKAVLHFPNWEWNSLIIFIYYFFFLNERMNEYIHIYGFVYLLFIYLFILGLLIGSFRMSDFIMSFTILFLDSLWGLLKVPFFIRTSLISFDFKSDSTIKWVFFFDVIGSPHVTFSSHGLYIIKGNLRFYLRLPWRLLTKQYNVM